MVSTFIKRKKANCTHSRERIIENQYTTAGLPEDSSSSESQCDLLPEMMSTMMLHTESHDCTEANQKSADPMSRRSNSARLACLETSKNRPRSKRGTPLECVLKGALGWFLL